MTTIDPYALWAEIVAEVEATAQLGGCFRATVSALSGGLVTIQRPEAATPDGEQYARLAGFALAVGDEVVCATINGKPVVLGKNQRAPSAAYALDNSLTLDGTLFVVSTATQAIDVQQGAAGNHVFRVDGANGATQVANGALLQLFKDNFLTQTAEVNGADGSSTFAGMMTLQSGLDVGGGAVTFPAGSLSSQAFQAGSVLLTGLSQSASNTASTTSTTTWADAIHVAYTLPAGTWTVLLVGSCVYWGNSTTDGVVQHLSNNTTEATGSNETLVMGTDNTRMETVGTLAGLTGAQTFYVGYEATSGSTANASKPSLLVFGQRTA